MPLLRMISFKERWMLCSSWAKVAVFVTKGSYIAFIYKYVANNGTNRESVPNLHINVIGEMPWTDT
ncbi:MAG: hypothetical protein ACE5RG_10895 [Candidatus Nitrosomaritimum yanchengensis]